MKIRTDFVTNSSSSSFAVEISLKDVDGKEYSVSINPDDGGGNGSADLSCTAEDITNSDSVDSLIALLKKAMRLIEPDEESIEEYYKEDPESYEGELKEVKRLRSEMDRFGDQIKQGVADIGRIASMRFKKTWSAWGEGASCFGWNLEIFAPGLSELAEELCNAEEGEPKDAARKALAAYLADFNGKIEADWGGEFPTDFLNASARSAIIWDRLADSIDAFAEMVMNEDLPNDDYAVETVEIDMQTHEIKGTAKYILNGMESIDDEQ